MPHTLLCFRDERIIVGADAVRTIIETRVERVRPNVGKGSVISLPIRAVVVLKHRQVAAH